jgi:hypothetical protein
MLRNHISRCRGACPHVIPIKCLAERGDLGGVVQWWADLRDAKKREELEALWQTDGAEMMMPVDSSGAQKAVTSALI